MNTDQMHFSALSAPLRLHYLAPPRRTQRARRIKLAEPSGDAGARAIQSLILIVNMCRLKLLRDDEFAMFSEELRNRIGSIRRVMDKQPPQ